MSYLQKGGTIGVLVYVISLVCECPSFVVFSFFCTDTATTEIYTYGHTLSLHDALPISPRRSPGSRAPPRRWRSVPPRTVPGPRPAWPGTNRRRDRKSTRLNSSH